MSDEIYIWPSDESCSKMFLNAANNMYYSANIQCSCGIDHIAIKHSSYSRCTLPRESLTVKHHDMFVVLGFEFNDEIFSYDCEGCRKTLRKYEDLFFKNQDYIKRYLEIRNKQEQSWSEQEKIKQILLRD